MHLESLLRNEQVRAPMGIASSHARFKESNLDPALAEAADGAPAAQLIEGVIRLENSNPVPPQFRIVARFNLICTGRFRAVDVWTIRRHPNVVSLKAARPLGLHEDDGHETSLARPEAAGALTHSAAPFSGRGCIVTALDFGLDFAHPNFLHQDGTTRLLAFWHQGAPYVRSRPNRFGYGRIYSRGDIDAAIRALDPYQALGYHPAISDAGNGSHGTHTLDIAAGSGQAPGSIPGIAPNADLLFVHVSTPRLGSVGNLGDSVRLLEALHWVQEVAGDRPWVVNLSLGRVAGSHDGTNLVEMGMHELLRLGSGSGRAIVQSCGNYRSANLAAEGWLHDGEYRDLEWIIDPRDTTPNEIDVWYPGKDRFIVAIRPPKSEEFVEVRLGEVEDLRYKNDLVGRIYHRKNDPNNHDNHTEVFLYPGAPPGVWTVRLIGDYVINGRFHAWIERDLARPGAQSRFDEGITSERYTLGSIATSPLVITVGAYDSHAEGMPAAPFSSCGPTRDERRDKPELLAPGVKIVAARSIPPGAARQEGLLIARSGTSMAAPHVTGTVAAMFEAAGRPVSIDEIRECLRRSAEPVPAAENPYCCGWGRLNIGGAISEIRALGPARRVSTPPGRAVLRESPAPSFEPVISDDAREELASISQERESDASTGATASRNAADRLLDRAEHARRVSYGGRLRSESLFLQQLLREIGCGLYGLSPADLFRAILHSGALGKETRNVLEVVGVSSQQPQDALRLGDWMLRATPGTGDAGHVSVLASADLSTPHALASAGVETESMRPGYYGLVIESGAFPHSRSRPFARRLLDSRGRVTPYTVVLRPKYSYFGAQTDCTSEKPEPGIMLSSSVEAPNASR